MHCMNRPSAEYNDCMQQQTESYNEYEKKLLGALIVISTGVEDAEALGLPADVGRNLMACYDALGEE